MTKDSEVESVTASRQVELAGEASRSSLSVASGRRCTTMLEESDADPSIFAPTGKEALKPHPPSHPHASSPMGPGVAAMKSESEVDPGTPWAWCGLEGSPHSRSGQSPQHRPSVDLGGGVKLLIEPDSALDPDFVPEFAPPRRPEVPPRSTEGEPLTDIAAVNHLTASQSRASQQRPQRNVSFDMSEAVPRVEPEAPWQAPRRRTAFSMESLSRHVPPSRPLQSISAEHGAWLREVLSKCVLFLDLDAEGMDEVVASCRHEVLAEGSIIIEQGALVPLDAPGLFVLESGEAVATKDRELVKEYAEKGSTFGELALMCNAPRAATVTARSACSVWSVDRFCVGHVRKASGQRQRRRFGELVKAVPLLSELDAVELGQVIDALQEEEVKAGDFIIWQGDDADKFYILVSGKAMAVRYGNEVHRYGPGEYFGELALLSDKPRAADVVAVEDCSLAVLEREAFDRLLGPLQSIQDQIQENARQYGGRRCSTLA